MMAGNPSWWSINGMHPQSHQQLQINPNSSNTNTGFQYTSAPPPPPPLPLPPPYHFYGGSSNSLPDHHPNQDFPRSWSQLLLGGLGNNEHWEDHNRHHVLNSSILKVGTSTTGNNNNNDHDDVKREAALVYGRGGGGAVDDEFQAAAAISRPPWSQIVPASSPTSCVTSLSSNLLNFSGSGKAEARNQHQENSSECNSFATGSVQKKPRIQHSSAQPALKVRKEKLGDRITSLHQLVSPFGKTDTASVLSEAIGYIRFLQAQIEALSSPYMGNVAGGSMGQPHQQQLSDVQDRPKDLRSRGLCLVPVSCTQHVGNETGADYWAPAALGGGF